MLNVKFNNFGKNNLTVVKTLRHSKNFQHIRT